VRRIKSNHVIFYLILIKDKNNKIKEIKLGRSTFERILERLSEITKET